MARFFIVFIHYYLCDIAHSLKDSLIYNLNQKNLVNKNNIKILACNNLFIIYCEWKKYMIKHNFMTMAISSSSNITKRGSMLGSFRKKI